MAFNLTRRITGGVGSRDGEMYRGIAGTDAGDADNVQFDERPATNCTRSCRFHIGYQATIILGRHRR